MSIDDSRGISIDTLVVPSIDYSIGISIDAFLVKLYARIELCSLGFLDQRSPYSSNPSSIRTDSGLDVSDDLSLQLLGQVLAS